MSRRHPRRPPRSRTGRWCTLAAATALGSPMGRTTAGRMSARTVAGWRTASGRPCIARTIGRGGRTATTGPTTSSRTGTWHAIASGWRSTRASVTIAQAVAPRAVAPTSAARRTLWAVAWRALPRRQRPRRRHLRLLRPPGTSCMLAVATALGLLTDMTIAARTCARTGAASRTASCAPRIARTRRRGSRRGTWTPGTSTAMVT
mmetsp:Transcript_11705/g.26884  ORF Transcript_11705/g.26884 Transcript_11705/m.26884 type:complete len:204 (-) Transcript_11705:592-1203(-)